MNRERTPYAKKSALSKGKHLSDTLPQRQKKKWFVLFAVLLLFFILLLLLRGCGIIRLPWESKPVLTISSGNIQEGTPGMTQDEILNAMQERADASRISIQINSRPYFEDGSSEGSLYIVNPVKNAFHMTVEIRLDDTDEVIYQSGLLAPNQFIDNDKLTKVLKKGEHNATAYLHAYDSEETDKRVNTATASLVITVKN